MNEEKETREEQEKKMINAYITGIGVTKVGLTPHVHALEEAISDEHMLRNSFLDLR